MDLKETNLNTYTFGEWSFDYSKSSLFHCSNNTTTRLEPKVSDLLLLLLKNNGDVVSRDKLIDVLWPNTVVGEDTLARTVSRLRSVLSDSAKKPKYIETIPKRGYRFLVPLETKKQKERPIKKPLYLMLFIFTGLALAAYLLPHTNITTSQKSIDENLARADSLYMEFMEQDNEAALALYEQVLEIDPSNARAQAGVTNTMIQRVIRWPAKQFKADQSETSLTAALRSGQLETSEAKLVLERARLLAEKAVRQSPNDIQVLKSLGLAYSAEGNINRAIQVYSQAITIDPQAWRSLVNLGELYALDGQDQKSLDSFIQAFEAMQTKFSKEPQNIRPLQPELGNVIASKYAELGNEEKVQEWTKKVLALVPFERRASTLLIESLNRSDSKNEAQSVCESYAKKLKPLKICKNF